MAIVGLAAHCRLTNTSAWATREAEQGSFSNLLCASLLRSPRRIHHSVGDVGALCEVEGDSEAVYLVCLVYLVYLVYFVL